MNQTYSSRDFWVWYVFIDPYHRQLFWLALSGLYFMKNTHNEFTIEIGLLSEIRQWSISINCGATHWSIHYRGWPRNLCVKFHNDRLTFQVISRRKVFLTSEKKTSEKKSKSVKKSKVRISIWNLFSTRFRPFAEVWSKKKFDLWKFFQVQNKI